MSFLGADWSFGNLKNKGKGILADPTQLMSNPLFSAGMGILSENQKPFGGDPFGAAMGGIMSAKGQQQADEDRKRQEEMREHMKKWFMAQQGQVPAGGGMTPNPYGAGMVPVAGSQAAAQAMQQPASYQIAPPGQPPSQQQFLQMLQQGTLPGMKTMELLYGGGLDRMLQGR